jgi:hypothetical protein
MEVNRGAEEEEPGTYSERIGAAVMMTTSYMGKSSASR